MNEREATFKANANHDDGTVPWRNDPSGRPFKSNRDKPLRPIAAFGCDREVQGGAACPHWCGQDKCGVVLAEPPTAGVKGPHPFSLEAEVQRDAPDGEAEVPTPKFHCAREGMCDVTPRCTAQCAACADGVAIPEGGHGQ